MRQPSLGSADAVKHTSAPPVTRASPAHDQPLAVCLSALAGYVDAVGFLWLGGIFISFMTGNTTRMGTEVGGPQWAAAAAPISVLLVFFAGVMMGASLRRVVRRGALWVLAFVTLLLLASSLLQEAGRATLAIGAATLAMGAENCVFESGGEVSVGLTYMTGTLVKMGQHAAAALFGGPRFGWLPHFMRWFALLAGAALGSLVYRRAGLEALWAAAAFAAALTVTSGWRHPGREGGR